MGQPLKLAFIEELPYQTSPKSTVRPDGTVLHDIRVPLGHRLPNFFFFFFPQSSNEEYLSINEELQSSNEELETAKEEMQSLNEELQTVNSELTNRNEGLVRANSDLLNLLGSTSIATLFLDNDLRIRRFTPRVLDIFKVRDGDEGRPIGDIVSGLARDGLAQDVKQVLRTLMPIEREVAMMDGRTNYLMQVRPYRDLNNVVDGAVVTFVDITERKLHEQARSLLAAIVDPPRMRSSATISAARSSAGTTGLSACSAAPPTRRSARPGARFCRARGPMTGPMYRLSSWTGTASPISTRSGPARAVSGSTCRARSRR